MGNINISDMSQNDADTGTVKAGSDGKVGGPGGTALTSSVVSVSSPVTGEQVFYNGTSWLTRPDTVFADPTVPNGTTDNTTYLQALVNSTAAAGQRLRIHAGTSGNWIISQLIVPSHALVDATGATFAQASGVNTQMVYNTSLTLGTPGSARDSNISWTGGTFVKGAGQQNVGYGGASGTGLVDMVLMFGFVDGLTLNNITVNQSGTGGNAGTGGRDGLNLWNVTNFNVNNFTANSASQSVNQGTIEIQYCQNGHVKGVYGTFGDDGVAIVNGAGGGDTLANGPSHSENITIEDVFATCPSNGVRLMPGSTAGVAPFYNVQRCSVKNVRGSMGSRGGSAAVFIGGTTTYSNLTGGYVLDCTIENVTNLLASTPGVYFPSSGAAEMHGIVLRDVNNQQDSPAISINGSTGHLSLTVENCDFTTAITTGSYYPIYCNSSVIRSLTLRNIRLIGATTGTATVALVQGVSGPGQLFVDGVRYLGKTYALGSFSSTTLIYARSILSEDVNALGYMLVNSGAVVMIKAASGLQSYSVDGFVGAVGSLTSYDLGFRCDLSTTAMQRVVGAMAWNTNASLSCGAGPCVCTTTAAGGWKNLATGNTY